MAQVNEYGMTYAEWLDGATWCARWTFGRYSRRYRRAWRAGEDFADYAAMFQNPNHPERSKKSLKPK